MPKLTIAEIEALMDQYFPDARKLGTIVALDDTSLTLRMPFRQSLVRAGGTISGPAMMALADTAAYFLLLAMAGPVAHAATAALSINFLSRPQPVDILATARMLKLGRRLAVSTVEIRSDGSDDVVAHATVTYAVPSS